MTEACALVVASAAAAVAGIPVELVAAAGAVAGALLGASLEPRAECRTW